MYRNICLIGLPYSGKTEIGKRLYKHLNKGFIDTDDIIRSKYKTNLSEIISRYGTNKYIEIESDVIHSLHFNNMVISTGGSVIYQPDTMNHLKKTLDSDIYHLFLTKQEFMKRSKNLQERGVIMNQDQTINDLYNERIHLYDIYSYKTISVNNKDIHEINLDLFKGETYLPSYDYKFYDPYNSHKEMSYVERYGNKLWPVTMITKEEKNVNFYDNYYWNPKSPVLEPTTSKPCPPL